MKIAVNRRWNGDEEEKVQYGEEQRVLGKSAGYRDIGPWPNYYKTKLSICLDFVIHFLTNNFFWSVQIRKSLIFFLG